MKYLIYIVLSILALLLTFFGLGPVLFADGTTAERMFTLLVVLLCYGLLFFILMYFRKKYK